MELVAMGPGTMELVAMGPVTMQLVAMKLIRMGLMLQLPAHRRVALRGPGKRA
jgi:hypothetical protein